MSTATLSPPQPVSRSRASSTTLRCNFSLNTLGRRRSTSCLNGADDVQPLPSSLPPVPPTPAPAEQFTIQVPVDTPASSPQDTPSMIVLIASRFLQWFHLPTKHTVAWSTPSSPRSSTDDFVLPVSASTQESFVIPVPEKPVKQQVDWRTGFPSVHAPILFVIISLPVSTAIVLYALSTLPINMSWPHTLSDLAQLGRELHGYSQSGPWPFAHVIAVMAISAVWKHAWSIPGSVLWNVLAGALFSPAFATIMLTALTTVGSACATLLAAPLAPFLTYMFPRALEMTRNALGGDSTSDLDQENSSSSPKSSPWVRLSILRLIGVVPWSGINIACGVCGVSLSDSMLGTFIGCLPWTAVTCQIGDILQTVASTPSPTPQTVSSLLTSPEIIFKLVFLSFLSLAPILGRDHLRAMIAPAAPIDSSSPTERNPRRSWVQQWRKKIRISSRSRTREQEQRQAELDILVQEKRRLEDLPS